MKNALIIYNSKTGRTKNFADEISKCFNDNSVNTKVVSIVEFKDKDLTNTDFVMLGCWTSGLFVILQKPESVWVEFANLLPSLKDKKIGFFTTYKLAVGSMFKNMRKHLDGKIGSDSIEIKSRNGKLSEENIKMIKKFIE